jgi:membrane protein implicated in regulation of membrane protease activity
VKTRAYPSTPLWVKLTLSALLATAAIWWLADRADRRGNEQRLSAIASQIAGRSVRVSWPGPLGWDIVEAVDGGRLDLRTDDERFP